MVHLLCRKGLSIWVDMLLKGRYVADGRIDKCGGRSIMVLFVKRQAGRMVIVIWITKSGRGCCLSILLGSDLLCSEEATSRAAGTTHSMFVATFMQIRLSLPRKPVNLVETGPCDTTLEDAEVLLCVYIERLFIYLVVIRWC